LHDIKMTVNETSAEARETRNDRVVDGRKLTAPVVFRRRPIALFGYAVRHRPLQYVPSRNTARFPVPRAAVRAQPLQYFQVPALRGSVARVCTPRAAVRERPLQHLEVPAARCPLARTLVPRTAVRAQPLQPLEIPALRRPRARLLVPWAAVLTQPLQHLELPVSVTQSKRVFEASEDLRERTRASQIFFRTTVVAQSTWSLHITPRFSFQLLRHLVVELHFLFHGIELLFGRPSHSVQLLFRGS